jgi:hypothetical protein
VIARYAYLSWLRHRLHQFLSDADRAQEIQHRALLEKVARNAASAFGRDHGFAGIRTVADFRARVPVLTYEDHHPYLSRVIEGEVTALFAPGTRILMYAMTSGTTGVPKRLPITEELFSEYQRGWRLWGAGLYGDYPRLLYRRTLQLSSDWQQQRTARGEPCGQISGLAATTRPKMSDLMFLPPAQTTQIHNPTAKHYATLRFALASRKVGMVITANPSTLIEFAKLASRQAESLIRDIHDGTLSCEAPAHVREVLARKIRCRRPRRARVLSKLMEKHGALLPKRAWPKLSVLGLWTGGSLSVFLPRLEEWYGKLPVRDHGLSASEGRMTIPLVDNTPAGLLDFYHHYFEFIPVEERNSKCPTVLEAHELVEGRDYFILLTTSGGLYRYDIHDVVRCVGYRGQAPLLVFLNKGKNTSNITGEKLTEYHVIRAVGKSFEELGLRGDGFTLAPVVEPDARYVLLLEPHVHGGRANELAARVHQNLALLNEEYASKCEAGRLLPVVVREVPAGTWNRIRQEKTRDRGNFEEFKHPCLVGDYKYVQHLFGAPEDSPQPSNRSSLAPSAV